MGGIYEYTDAGSIITIFIHEQIKCMRRKLLLKFAFLGLPADFDELLMQGAHVLQEIKSRT